MSAMAQQQRALELTLLSAKDLKDVNLLSKMKVYALVSLLIGDPVRSSRQRVAPDWSGGRNPIWNATLRFTVPANAAGSMHVLLRAERALGDRDVGEVHIPLSELLSWAPDGVMPVKFVAYQVSKIGSGRPQGVLNFSYKLGELVTHGGGQAAYHPAGKVDAYAPTQSAYPPPQSAYAPLTAPGAPPLQYSYGYPAQQQLAGYGYPPPPPQGGYGYGYPQQQPAGYGYPPPPPQGGYGHGYPQQQQPAGYGCPPQPPEGGYRYGYHYQQQAVKPPKKSGMGMGLGAGLLGGALGGLLIGDMISDSSGGAGF